MAEPCPAIAFLTSFGLLFAAGIACFLLGGSMLFDMPDLSDLSVSFWSVLVPVVGGFALFAALVIYAVGRTFLRDQTAGVSELVGLVGKARTGLRPEGTVFVRGEYWMARADEEIPAGERVEVAAVEGWTYLSVTDDVMATQPTFINESNNTIISLRQFRLRSWPPVEGEVTTRQYGEIAVEWVSVDHRRVGRITKKTPQGEVDAIVMAMTHVRKSELNHAVVEFCHAIRWISSNDER